MNLLPRIAGLCLVAALAVNTPAGTAQGSGDPSLAPIPVAEASDLSLGFYSDVGYQNQDGRFYVDVLEQDFVYMTLIVTDADGRAVVGAKPSFEKTGKSLISFPEDDEERSKTRGDGTVDFGVIGGQMGMDEITVTVGDASAVVMVNVISLAAAGFPTLPTLEGGLDWPQLMAAQVRWEGDEMNVTFPPEVEAKSGERVLLSGFMMPLDPDLTQRRFLLTSNPPSCFFHIPGGPSGAVEVLAPDGIEASWDPLVLEGRFEAVTDDELGVIYRLHDAEVLPQ